MIYTIGIEPDIKLIERLTFLQADLGKIAAARGADSRWIRPEYMNFPLVCLGVQDEGDIPEMNHLIERCTRDIAPFRISVAGISAHPAPDCPRLIQIAIDMGRERVFQLREALTEALQAANFGYDRRSFQPVMLMGRIVTPNARIDLTDAIQAIQDLNFGGSDVFEVGLFGAELSDIGTIHPVISRHPLGGKI